MRTTKYGTATALLIAILAVALVPTAAAETPDECVMNDPLVSEEPGNDRAADCIGDQHDECDERLTDDQDPEKYLTCFLLDE